MVSEHFDYPRVHIECQDSNKIGGFVVRGLFYFRILSFESAPQI